MDRIMVIGPCGAGKSTAAARLADLTGLPLIHMDKLNWQPGWVETGNAELRAKVSAAAAGDSWIIEGNYGGTMELRLARATCVLYLDYPIPLCLWRIVKRIRRYRGTTRPDMTEGCEERFNLPFLWYVAGWRWGPGPRTEAKIKGHEDKIVRLKSPAQLDAWMAQMITGRVSSVS